MQVETEWLFFSYSRYGPFLRVHDALTAAELPTLTITAPSDSAYIDSEEDPDLVLHIQDSLLGTDGGRSGFE